MTTKKRRTPPAPEHLSDRSKAIYRGIVTERKGWISPPRLTLLCEGLSALDRADQARLVINIEGMTFATEETGTVHVHPAIRIERDARNAFVRCWQILGLHFDATVDGRLT